MQLHFQQASELDVLTKKIYEREKLCIKAILPQSDIQHVGSTAIPGLLTKGDIDICVRVKPEYFEKAREQLETLYMLDTGNPPTETYTGFEMKDYSVPLGIQLVAIGSKDDEAFNKTKDILLKNKGLREKFNQLKQSFEGKDNLEYRKAKSLFINDILQTYR